MNDIKDMALQHALPIPTWADIGAFVSPREHIQLGPTAALRRALKVAPLTGLEILSDPESVPLSKSVQSNCVWSLVDAASYIKAGNRFALEGPFDVIVVNHALERVRVPVDMLKQVSRLLSPYGRLLVLAANMRPMGSNTLWNVTPLALLDMARAADLAPLEFRAGIDAQCLIERAYKGNPPEMSRYFGEESPLNADIAESYAAAGRTVRQINLRKLQFCGLYSAELEHADKPKT